MGFPCSRLHCRIYNVSLTHDTDASNVKKWNYLPLQLHSVKCPERWHNALFQMPWHWLKSICRNWCFSLVWYLKPHSEDSVAQHCWKEVTWTGFFLLRPSSIFYSPLSSENNCHKSLPDPLVTDPPFLLNFLFLTFRFIKKKTQKTRKTTLTWWEKTGKETHPSKE